MKIFIESARDIPVPTAIEVFRTNMPLYKDRTVEEKYTSLIEVVYRRIIVANTSADPSGRMKPQDIVREIILLNCMCEYLRTHVFASVIVHSY